MPNAADPDDPAYLDSLMPWSQSRYFSYSKIQELYDEKRAAAPAATGKPDGELAEEARKMILASLQLAEKVETA